MHGNPYRDRKIVLSNELLDKGELSPVTVVKSSDMIDRFLFEVNKATKTAFREKANVLLLVFCHGLYSSSLLLDAGNKDKGLTAVRLRAVIGPYVPTTLVTTACYSGGWTASPDLNITTMTAAGKETGSVAWPNSESIGRASGCVFVSSVIDTMTATSSPLLDQSERTISASDEESLQPKSADKQQTETYNEFCRTIWEICSGRLHRPWRDQEFSFPAQDDEWKHSWTGRTGFPLSNFHRRWDALATYPYTGSMEMKELRDPSPLNTSFFSGTTSRPHTASSGSTLGHDSTYDELIKSMHEYRLVQMLENFLTTCPGQWDTGMERGVRVFFKNCIKAKRAKDPLGDEYEEEVGYPDPRDAFRIVHFRVNLATMADYFVSCFQLPLPNDQTCLAWDYYGWLGEMESTLGPVKYMELRHRSSAIRQRLSDGGFIINPDDSQGPPFYHVDRYMAAALAGANRTQAETMQIIGQILEFVKAGKKFYLQLACEQAEAKRSGREWLKSLGRRVRKSLSPTKRARKSIDADSYGSASEASGSGASEHLEASMGALSLGP